MELCEFQQILTESNTYTFRGTASSMFRMPGLTTPWFLLQLAKVHFDAARKTDNTAYYPAEWQADSFVVFRDVLRIGGTIVLSGLDHLRGLTSAAVIIGNHMSSLETMLLPSIVLPFGDATFIIKDQLMRYPLLGKILRKVHVIAVSRANPREDLKIIFRDGSAMLDNGRSIIVFPQHTRTAKIDPDSFNSLGVKLAKRANVPIVPMALKTDLWSNGTWIKDLGRIDPGKTVHFEFGAPITVTSNAKAAHEEVLAFICSRVDQWSVES